MQEKINLPPPTEADYQAGRRALLALMSPEGRARVEAFAAKNPIREPRKHYAK